MRYYRIGDFARRMGVSTHLLKYYEDEQLISPVVQKNGYRFYNLRDSSVLIQCRALRNLNVPVRSMKTLQQSDHAEALLEQHADFLKQDLHRRQALLAELQRQCGLLKRMDAGEERFVRTPGGWYLPHAVEDELDNTPALQAMLEVWMDWMPIVKSCLLVDCEKLLAEQPTRPLVGYGFLLPADAAKAYGLPTGAPAQSIPPQRVWRRYAAIDTGLKGELSEVFERDFLRRGVAAGARYIGPLRKIPLLYTETPAQHRIQHCIMEAPVAEE